MFLSKLAHDLISKWIIVCIGCFLTKRFISPTLSKNKHKKRQTYATDGNGFDGFWFEDVSTKVSVKLSSPIIITNT